METNSTYPWPGIYQYTYPTFVDTPQHICVHFLTFDGQQAFVSYPRHPNRKVARLIPVSWFQSVNMIELDGQPCLMNFIEVVLTGWFRDQHDYRPAGEDLFVDRNEYGRNKLFAV